MKLVYVVNEASFFLSHRLPLAREAQARGFDVFVACGEGTGADWLSAARCCAVTHIVCHTLFVSDLLAAS